MAPLANSAYALSAALVAVPILVLLLRRRRPSKDERNAGGLHLPPGPPRLPVIGNLHQLAGAGALPHRALRELSARYGPLMYLQLGELRVLVVSSSEAAKEVLKTHDLAFASRPQTVTAQIISSEGEGVVITPYGDHWRQMRKICVLELLSVKRVLSFRSIREEEVGRLVQEIVSSPTEVNISKLVSQTIADAAVHAMAGRSLKNRDYFLERLQYGLSIVSGMSLADLFPSSRLARLLSVACRRIERHRQIMFSFLDGVIKEHEQQKVSEAEHEDLLDVLLRIQREGELDPPLTSGQTKNLIIELFAAGSETSSTTIQWAFLELMRNPEAMEKAQSEVRRVAGSDKGKVSEQDIQEMHYLKLVIKEALRLHTPVPLLIPKECREDCQVHGFDVPKGTMVLVNAWAIARDPQLWDRPEEFNPERFDGLSRDFKGTDFEYIPFGAGRRVCPGMHFGLANVEITLAALLYHFDWQVAPDHELDVSETSAVTARPKKDLIVTAKPRILPF